MEDIKTAVNAMVESAEVKEKSITKKLDKMRETDFSICGIDSWNALCSERHHVLERLRTLYELKGRCGI